MDFRKKNEISRRIAREADIPVYRVLLAQYGSGVASRLSSNKAELARDMVYELLERMDEEQIKAAVLQASARPEAPSPAAREAAPAPAATVKKKSTNSPSTRPSDGMNSTGLTSGRPTLFSRIGSAFGLVSGLLSLGFMKRQPRRKR